MHQGGAQALDQSQAFAPQSPTRSWRRGDISPDFSATRRLRRGMYPNAESHPFGESFKWRRFKEQPDFFGGAFTYRGSLVRLKNKWNQLNV
jgi:hypothetical protein